MDLGLQGSGKGAKETEAKPPSPRPFERLRVKVFATGQGPLRKTGGEGRKGQPQTVTECRGRRGTVDKGYKKIRRFKQHEDGENFHRGRRKDDEKE